MDLNYQAVFKLSPAPMMVLDKELKFAAANPAYLKMVGKSEDDLIGVYVFDAFPEAQDRVESMIEIFQAGLRGEEPTISEIPFSIRIEGVVTEQWWTAWHARLEGADGAEYVIQFSENVTDQVRMRQMRDAMLAEMQHRIGNIFAMIGATARIAARKAGDVREFMSEFEDRLEAFVKVTHQLAGSADGRETVASVVNFQLNAHARDAQDRLTVEGPELQLSEMQAQALSMAVHELATNSMKYGALGKVDGRLVVSWDALPGGGGQFHWRETGVAASKETKKEGYGAMLLDRIIPSQLNGAAVRKFGADGFTYSLQIGETG